MTKLFPSPIRGRVLRRLAGFLLSAFLLGIPVLFYPAWASPLSRTLESLGAVVPSLLGGAPSADSSGYHESAVTVQASAMAYTYDLDTTLTATMATTTDTGDNNSKDSSSRLKSKVRLTPSTVAGEFFLQLEEPLELFGSDESGNLLPQPVKTEFRDALKQAIKVQQATDGAVLGITFPASYLGLNNEETEGIKNALRGVASLFDYRLIQPNTALQTVAEDVSGKFQALYERGTAGLVVRKKLAYLEYAPGSGLFDISDGGETLIPSTADHTGETRIELDASNRIKSVSQNDSLRMSPSGNATPGATTEIAINGTNNLQANLVFSGSEAPNSNLISPQALSKDNYWGKKESLRAEMGCYQAQPTLQSAANLDEILANLAVSPNPRGHGIHLVRALREAGDTQTAAEWLKNGRLSLKAREEVIFALGMIGNNEAQEILFQIFKDDVETNEARAQALLSLQAQARPSAALLANLESYAFQAAGAPQDMAKFALGSLAGKLDPSEAQTTNRIISLLVTRAQQSRNEREKLVLVTALGATRREAALPALEMALEDSSPRVQEVAARTLQAFSGAQADQILARAAARKSLFKLAPMTIESPLSASEGSSKDCGDMAQRLGYDPQRDKFICKSWNLDKVGDLGFFGAYGRITAGAGSGGTFSTGFYADARVDGGLFFKVLGTELKVIEFWAYAGMHTKDPARRKFGMDYAWFGVNFPQIDWPTDDQTGSVDLGGRGKGYKWCGPLGPFWWCLEVGVKLDYGIEKGRTTKAVEDELYKTPPAFDALQNASEQRAMYWMLAPYGQITAYVEGRISFACLRVRARLQGSFLIHKYPVRLVLDFHDALHSNDLTSTDVALLIDEYRRSWRLDLIGTFDYCIGSKSKVLWTKGGAERTRRLLTYRYNQGDFAISNFNWTVEKPSEATPLALTVDTINNGPYSTSPYTPLKGRVYVDGARVSEFEFKDGNGHSMRLFPGQTATTQALWPNPTQGNHIITIKLDEDNDLAETNRSNQSISTAIYVFPKLPEFSISKVIATSLDANTTRLEVVSVDGGAKRAIETSVVEPPMSNDSGPRLVFGNTILVSVRVSFRGQTLANVSAFSSGSVLPSQGGSFASGYRFATTAYADIPKIYNGLAVDNVDITIDPDNQFEEVSDKNNSVLGFRLGEVIQDIQPPSLKNLAINGSIGQIPMAVEGSDNIGITKTEFYVDGVLRATAMATPPYPISQTFATTLDSSLVADGLHSLYAKAYDTTGNAATTSSLSFTVQNALDRELPVVTVAKEEGTGGNISFTALAIDNVAVRRLDFYVDGQIIGSLASASGTLWKDSTIFTDGPHSLYVRAVDAANNTGASSPTSFVVKNDSEAPTVISSVLGTGGTVTLNASASDNKGISKIEFHIDSQLRAAVTATLPFQMTSNFTTAFDSKGLANGLHTLVAKAYDPAGNVGISQPVAFTITNNTDTQPPVISGLTVMRVINRAPISIDIDPVDPIITYRLTATSTDNVGVTRVDFYVGGEFVGSRTSSSSTFLLVLDDTYSGMGIQTVRAVAIDAAGNFSAKEINYSF